MFLMMHKHRYISRGLSRIEAKAISPLDYHKTHEISFNENACVLQSRFWGAKIVCPPYKTYLPMPLPIPNYQTFSVVPKIYAILKHLF